MPARPPARPGPVAGPVEQVRRRGGNARPPDPRHPQAHSRRSRCSVASGGQDAGQHLDHVLLPPLGAGAHLLGQIVKTAHRGQQPTVRGDQLEARIGSAGARSVSPWPRR